MPTISFLFGGYWLEMRPEDYILKEDGQCWVCLDHNGSDDSWLLGDTFLRGFYSTHDYTNKKFGFAPHATSLKSAPIAGSRNSKDMLPLHQKWLYKVYWKRWLLFATLVIVIIALIVWISMKWCC